jgi:hypothetical protein
VHQVAGRNEVATALERYMPTLQSESTLPVPSVLLSEGLTLDGLFSKNMRKQLKRSRTKIDAELPGWTIDFVRGTDGIMALLPEIEETHIGRDHERRQESDLDNALSRRFWQETVVTHTYTDELELAVLMVHGTVAAYVLALVDGSSYRVFDGRMNGQFAKYSPGRILEAACLERALNDKHFTVFDWMTGVAPETILAANDWEQRTILRASGTTKVEQDPEARPRRKATRPAGAAKPARVGTAKAPKSTGPAGSPASSPSSSSRPVPAGGATPTGAKPKAKAPRPKAAPVSAAASDATHDSPETARQPLVLSGR